MFFNVVARTLCGAAFGFVFSKGLMWIGKAGSPKKNSAIPIFITLLFATVGALSAFKHG